MEGMNERWHFVSRIKELNFFDKIPRELSQDIRLVIALVYEAMVEASQLS